jgi:hypothetical protein
MYATGTILKLRNPKPDVEVGEGEEKHSHPFPYNEVRVLGVSPLNHSTIDSEWVGQQGQGVIIEPISSFGSNLDEPFGKLQDLYEVVSMPEPQVIENTVRVVTPAEAGPSPEDKFASDQKAEGIKKSEKRVATPISPLDDDPDAEERAKDIKAARERILESSSD